MLKDLHPVRHSDCGLSGYEYRRGKGGASAFLTKLANKWEDKTGMNAKRDRTGMFRGQVQRLLPPSVQAKLDDVVGLSKKPFGEWEDTLVHHLGKCEKSKGSDPEEEKQALELAWLKAQLKEVHDRKNAAPGQAAPQMAVVALVHQTPVGPLQGPVPVVPAPQVVYYQVPPAQLVATPTPLAYQVPPAQPVGTPTPLAYTAPPKPYMKGVNKVVICFNCGQPGHLRSSCPSQPGLNLASPVSPSGQGPAVQYQVVLAPSCPSQPGLNLASPVSPSGQGPAVQYQVVPAPGAPQIAAQPPAGAPMYPVWGAPSTP